MHNASETYTALDQFHPELSAALHTARSNLLALTSTRHPVLTAWQQAPALRALSRAGDDCYRELTDRHIDLILVNADNDYYDALSPWSDGETAFTLYCDVFYAAAFTHYVPDEPISSTDPFRATYTVLQELVVECAKMPPLTCELFISLLTTWHGTLPDLLAATATLSTPVPPALAVLVES
jgi:hypothetical protein